MSSAKRAIIADITMSKAKGKALVEKVNKELTPEAIASYTCNPPKNYEKGKNK